MARPHPVDFKGVRNFGEHSQGEAQVFKKYSQMKLQMKRDALEKLNRQAGEVAPLRAERMCTVTVQ